MNRSSLTMAIRTIELIDGCRIGHGWHHRFLSFNSVVGSSSIRTTILPVLNSVLIMCCAVLCRIFWVHRWLLREQAATDRVLINWTLLGRSLCLRTSIFMSPILRIIEFNCFVQENPLDEQKYWMEQQSTWSSRQDWCWTGMDSSSLLISIT